MSAVVGVRRRLRLRRPRLALSRRMLRLAMLGSVVAGLLLTGGWFLLRDSSLVAVEHVTITGERGPDAGPIRLALESAALKMTTLDVQTGRLRAAVSGFPEVKGLRVSTAFPHRLVIHVIEVLPIAVVKMFGREVPVTRDGTLLTNVSAHASLPLITLAVPPSGGRLQQQWALDAARLLAAAPPSLLPRLAEATTVAGHGLVVQVRSGPSIYFGDATELQAKWSAVVAVLADPGSAGATYIDVTDPERPVAGGDTSGTAASGSSGTASSGVATAATGASTSPVTGASTSVAGASSTAPSTGASTATSTGAATGTSSGASAGTSTVPTGG